MVKFNSEYEIELRRKINLKDCQNLIWNIFKEKSKSHDICIEQYRETGLSESKYRQGVSYKLEKKSFNTMMDYIQWIDKPRDNCVNIIDMIKTNICFHLKFFINEKYFESHQQFPRIFVIKYADELDLTDRPKVKCEIINQIEDFETDASDANFEIKNIIKLYYIDKNGIRLAINSIINSFSEITYEFSLEKEFKEKIENINDLEKYYELFDKKYMKIEYNFINPNYKPIGTDDLLNVDLFKFVCMMSKKNHDINEIFKNLDNEILKLKYNGITVYGIYNGSTNLILNNNKIIDLTMMFDLNKETIMKNFSINYIYQLEYLENEKLYVFTEILSCRNLYSCVNFPLLYTFAGNKGKYNKPKLYDEQKPPFGYLGVGLLKVEIEHLCKLNKCKNRDYNFKNFIEINDLQSNLILKNMKQNLNEKRCKFNLFIENKNLENIEYYKEVVENKHKLYDGLLFLKVQTIKNDNCNLYLEKKNYYYEKIKINQTVELKYNKINNIEAFFMNLGKLFMYKNKDIWYRFDDRIIKFIIKNRNFEFIKNKIYEFEIINENTYKFKCLRTDKNIPDSESKVIKIAFEQNVKNVSMDEEMNFIDLE